MLTILITSTLPLLILAGLLYFGVWKMDDPPRILGFIVCCPVACLLSIGMHALGTYNNSYFKEVWACKVVAVRYYERWNERVACRHPIYVTQTHTDSKGNSYTTQTLVGYEHAYDVDDHPEHWEAVTEGDGDEHEIDHSTYAEWVRQWNNRHFVNMHRHYHTINGNMYETVWDGRFYSIYPWQTTHTYENKVRVSRSAFSFVRVDEATRKAYPRPADVGTDCLFGYGVGMNAGDEWNLRRLNAELGPSYRVRCLVLLFDANQYGQDVVERVRNAWQGPNKNELVTCVGIGTGGKVVWCDVFSWMEDTTIHSLVRQDVVAMGNYDTGNLLNVLRTNVKAEWHKRSFKDFDYLSVSLPVGYVVTSYLLSLVTCVAGYVIVEKNCQTDRLSNYRY